MIGPFTYTMPTAGLALRLLRGAPRSCLQNFEEGERRGEIQLRLALAAILLVKDDVLAVALLEHRFEVLALLDGINQARRLWPARR